MKQHASSTLCKGPQCCKLIGATHHQWTSAVVNYHCRNSPRCHNMLSLEAAEPFESSNSLGPYSSHIFLLCSVMLIGQATTNYEGTELSRSPISAVQVALAQPCLCRRIISRRGWMSLASQLGNGSRESRFGIAMVVPLPLKNTFFPQKRKLNRPWCWGIPPKL